MTDTLQIHQHPGGIVVLTFNRPEARNALDLATMRRFADVITELQADVSLRVLILTGAGTDAFCSGGDLVELSGYPTQDDARAFITLMGDALLAMEHLPVPVIAAVNGYALGGGSEIALACDIRIVDEQARMGFVQINLALTPGWGAGQRLLRLVGYARAMDILLQGRVMHAPELHALDLVNQIVEPGAALQHALNYARQINQRPPDVVHGVKSLLRAGLVNPYAAALQIEREIFPPLWAADAHLQAVDQFLARHNHKEEA